MLGEGIGMVALKRLERRRARRRPRLRRDHGRRHVVRRPQQERLRAGPRGQARALRRAYDLAGYGPETVELVEAHGTGTKAGDAAEFEGLDTRSEREGREDRQWCALGSVKSQIGHTKAAAGAAGLFKAVMALHHKVLPPTIKVDRPTPS
jgi:acyl transferase domain-containing protein